MGVAIASAAWRRGADVVLVAGPLSIEPSVGAKLVKVETTEEMRDAIDQAVPEADALVMAAAPADFRPAEAAAGKIKKSRAPIELPLTPTPDILSDTRAARRRGMVVVGFALETDNVLDNARKKLEAKDLDLVVLNDAREAGAGFEVETNRVTLIARNGKDEALPLLPKHEVADAILDRVAEMMRGR